MARKGGIVGVRAALIAMYESQPAIGGTGRWTSGSGRDATARPLRRDQQLAKLRAGEPVTVSRLELQNATGVRYSDDWHHAVIGPDGSVQPAVARS